MPPLDGQSNDAVSVLILVRVNGMTHQTEAQFTTAVPVIAASASEAATEALKQAPPINEWTRY